MTTPLLMTGPGGDYVTRYDIKGDGLVKTRTKQSQGHSHDDESAGNSVAWGFLGRRRKNKKAQANTPRREDHFEHTESPALPATYAKPAAISQQQQLAMLQAIEHWLTGQQGELDRLAAIQTATQADMVRDEAQLASKPAAAKPSTPAQASPAPVRVIRFNSTTMDLPTPAPALVPEPCHAFASHETNQDFQSDNSTSTPTPTQRSVNDDKPQPHPQANENFDINSRHPAIARLFADDERARRSARRLQGHHLRTRRSTDQKGLPRQGCEQSTLFGAVA